MNLQLKRLRKEAGIKSQKVMADKLGVPVRRYESWEREEVMMNLEQAYNCAVVLGCTIDEIAGRETPALSAEENQLVDCYRRTDESDRPTLLATASTMAFAGEAKKESHHPTPSLAREDVK